MLQMLFFTAIFQMEEIMTSNIGNTDRIIRIVAGIAVLASFFVLDGNARLLALVGIVPLATGLFRWCPAYALLGLNTCGTRAT